MPHHTTVTGRTRTSTKSPDQMQISNMGLDQYNKKSVLQTICKKAAKVPKNQQKEVTTPSTNEVT